jgi:hypothetical protein
LENLFIAEPRAARNPAYRSSNIRLIAGEDVTESCCSSLSQYLRIAIFNSLINGLAPIRAVWLVDRLLVAESGRSPDLN